MKLFNKDPAIEEVVRQLMYYKARCAGLESEVVQLKSVLQNKGYDAVDHYIYQDHISPIKQNRPDQVSV